MAQARSHDKPEEIVVYESVHETVKIVHTGDAFRKMATVQVWLFPPVGPALP